MNFVEIRFYEELNDFLDPKKRKKEYQVPFLGKRTVKDIIEGEGVPHVEVDLILANSNPVSFDYHVQHKDHISVYPEFELLDISSLNRLRPKPLRFTRFIIDANLGKLSRYLRMVGFDTVFDLNLQDADIIHVAKKEKRIILTRDLGILKNGAVTRGYFIRNQFPDEQFLEAVRKFNLLNQFKPFSRCIACNGVIKPAKKEKIIHLLPENTKNSFNEFYQCGECQRIYWKGSHYESMLNKIEKLVNV